MVQDDLDRVAPEQRKADEDDCEYRLQALKNKDTAEKQKAKVEEQRARSLFIHKQGFQAEYDRP